MGKQHDHEADPERSADMVESSGEDQPAAQAHGSVPAGGSGADTGAAEAVEVDDADRGEVPNVSSTNDIPGVGTRGPSGEMESTVDPAARGEQHSPRLDQNDAGLGDKLAGIVVQVRADLGDAPDEDIRRMLEQRLRGTGIDLDQVDIEAAIAAVRNDGDDMLPRPDTPGR